ncbi:MAG: MoaD/ThiS family protein [Deltaproteobacteria bacterium]|nr:MoaD/ThiS family protein [Deltaproteobacteria bacterium]MBW2395026.1 MoaD/ThiS family protein [Deltaproteobacteria bacterium]
MKVSIPQPLRGYTGAEEVEAEGASVDELLRDLDRLYPGLRFRVVDERDRLRPHVRVFVNRERVRSLEQPLREGDQVQILQALSGG